MKLHYSRLKKEGYRKAALIESDAFIQLNTASSTTEKFYYMIIVKA